MALEAERDICRNLLASANRQTTKVSSPQQRPWGGPFAAWPAMIVFQSRARTVSYEGDISLGDPAGLRRWSERGGTTNYVCGWRHLCTGLRSLKCVGSGRQLYL